jgi:hypothetical protein
MYPLSNIICKIKPRKLSWVWHVAGMQEKRDACKVCLGNLKERNLSGDIGITFVNNIKVYHKQRIW